MYVLIKFPVDTAYFEENKIGFHCYGSPDNGARYVPVEDYRAYFGKEPEQSQLYAVVEWPESQRLIEKPDVERECEFINDMEAQQCFSLPAYWCPKSFLHLF